MNNNFDKQLEINQGLLHTNLLAYLPMIKAEFSQKNKTFTNKQFESYVAQWMQTTPQYWRQIKNKYKPIKPEFLRKIEKAHGMALGQLDVVDEINVYSSVFAFECALFVRNILQDQNLQLDPDVELKLIKNVYDEGISSGNISKELVLRFITMLS